MSANPLPCYLALRTTSPSQLPQILSEIRDIGFDGAELSLPALDVVHGGNIRLNVLHAVAACVEKSQLQVSLHAPLSLNLMDVTHAELHRTIAEATLTVAAAIGAKTVVFHPGWLPRNQQFAGHHELIAWEAQCLGELAQLADLQGVRIALENMPAVSEAQVGDRTTYGMDPELIARQIRAGDHPALIGCLDVSHAAIAATARGCDLYQDIRAMAPFIGHLHLHDSFARVPEVFIWLGDENATFGQGDTHLPLGWGDLDFTHLLQGLPVLPDTVAVLELLGRYHQPHTLAESLTAARSATSGVTIFSP